MRARFTQSFKIQAVEKALSRTNDKSLKEVADDLGIGQSTLGKWIGLAQKQKLEPSQNTEVTHMTKAKRPQDWNVKDR
ncbi:Mobile element protein [uncultured Candidatus Thioglobus sp.]|nr:Mobile element protein [uncultured Candidatus Thioglobus sp.]